MNNLKIESKENTVNTPCFLYADDIAFISKTRAGICRANIMAELHSKENFY
jgi:hypothetical protein